METNIKYTTLRKKIDGIVYDLMAKTNTKMVDFDDTTTLDVKLASMLSDIADTKTKLEDLIGTDGAGSITSQIEAAVAKLTDETDTTSLGGKVKILNDAVDAINNTDTGILAKAKEYTDTVEAALSAKLAGAFHFKGKVNYVDQLPTENIEAGDVYQVMYAGESSAAGTNRLDAEYGYNGTEWVELGSFVDLSNYSTTTQVNEAIATAKSEAITAADEKLQTEVGKINDVLATKGRILVSATQPEDLTEADLWLQIIEEETPTA